MTGFDRLIIVIKSILNTKILLMQNFTVDGANVKYSRTNSKIKSGFKL